MALADRLREVEARPSCKLCLLLGYTLDADDADTLRSWVKDGVPHAAIARALTAEGHKIDESSVKRHRKHS